MSNPVDKFPPLPSEQKDEKDEKDGNTREQHGHDGHVYERHRDEHGQDAISPLESDYRAPSFNDQDSRQGTVQSNRLKVNTEFDQDTRDMMAMRSPSAAREQSLRLEDDLALLEAERVASVSTREETGDHEGNKSTLSRTRSRRSENVDEFDEATNPLHEKAAVYNPPEDPNTKLSAFIKRLHDSSFIVRYFTYIVPVVLLLLIPLLVGALAFPNATVGGVELLWFSVWLEIVWLTLWAGRIVSKLLPIPIGILASIFTNNAKKWRDCARQLEIHATIFFWWLGVEISFLPTMKNHHLDKDQRTRSWENTLNRLIISFFVWTVLNLIEKFIIQLIAISFHTRTYADRIEINKFQIGSLTKLYGFSRERIANTDADFEERSAQPQEDSGFRAPLKYAGRAQRVAKGALNKVGDVAGAVAADFTGRKATNSTHPHTVVLTLLRSTSGCQLLARRLYRTFVRDGFDTVFAGDLKEAFDNSEEADAAFAMFDRDMNGDISMEELEAACVEIGRERKSITASLKDLDSVVSRLDNVLEFFVVVISIIVFLTLISTSAAGVLTSAGSSVLALSWLFSATAQEFLQSVVFVFVKHPFDVGDRVTVYGNSGDAGLGDDYFVKSISLLYTEFKKMQGHIVQAPNSYLNSLFILNQRRSGALAEAVPVTIKYGTTLEQIDGLRQRLVEFVRSERREFQANILTEMRQVTDNFSITLNVVFFYKSNWQNEGLRLQRRNKFICMLMIALQEIGIEGSRMNLQGAHVDYPVHVNYHGLPLPAQPPPSYDNNDNNNNNNHHPGGNNNPPSSISSGHLGSGGNAGPSSLNPPGSSGSNNPPPSAGGGSGATRHPSILRKGMTTAAARARGDSVASRKHVDFSLGMSGIATGDLMGDVFEDRAPARVDVEQLRETNRENNERRIQQIQEEEEDRRSRSSSRAASQQGKHSMSNTNLSVPGSNHDGGRRSTESHGSSLHNRFFRRRSRSNVSSNKNDLEQGQGQSSAHMPASPEAKQ